MPGWAEAWVDWGRALLVHGHVDGRHRWLGGAARAVWVFVRTLTRDEASLRAAAMAYTSLVALVPSLVLVFAMLEAVGVVATDRETLEDVVFSDMLGDVPGVRETLVPGLEQAHLGTLGLVGVVVLASVAWQLFVQAEYAYCAMYGVDPSRPLWQRVAMFVGIVTAVPIVLTTGFLRSSSLLDGVGVAGSEDLVLLVFLYALVWLTVLFLPATTVRAGPSAVGSAVVVALLATASEAFRLYVEMFLGAGPTGLIYGSLAAFPMFLLWLYLVWMAVLVGVEVAAVSQQWRFLLARELSTFGAPGAGAATPGVDAALLITTLLATHDDPVSLEDLAKAAGSTPHGLHPVVEALVHGGIAQAVEGGFGLCRSADHLTLRDVAAAWHGDPLSVALSGDVLTAIRDELDDALDGTVADAVERWHRDD